MISFDLIKKWIKDHMNPVYAEEFHILDADLNGEWCYINDDLCYKFIDTVIMHYRRILLLTCAIENNVDGTSTMRLIKVEEVFQQ
jgi:hypothetical protein